MLGKADAKVIAFVDSFWGMPEKGLAWGDEAQGVGEGSECLREDLRAS